MFPDLDHFDWSEVGQQTLLGQGAYGVVNVARYRERDVALKIPHEITGNEKEFAKEVKLLNSVRGHQNVVSFLAVCVRPYAIMTEYVAFSFERFDDEKVVSSLSDFLVHVHSHYDFKGFEHVVPIVAKDVAVGLKFLHDNDIVHRDLKPANILLTIKHYVHMPEDELQFIWKHQPVICKIADFGEGRSAIIQMQTLLSSKVQHLNRGSPAYMAPEAFLPERQPTEATLELLKAVDSWAYGMVLFILANPSLRYPYQEEVIKERSSNPLKDSVDSFREILRRLQHPQCATSTSCCM